MSTAEDVAALQQELADLRSGVPMHQHFDSQGKSWRCTSPYCERGGDVRDKPQPAPGETEERAERYRRRNA